MRYWASFMDIVPQTYHGLGLRGQWLGCSLSVVGERQNNLNLSRFITEMAGLLTFADVCGNRTSTQHQSQNQKHFIMVFSTFDIQCKHVYYVLLCIYPTSLTYSSSLQMPHEHGVWTLSMPHGRMRLHGIGVFTLVNNEGL